MSVRLPPVSSKYLDLREKRQQYNAHRKRITTASSNGTTESRRSRKPVKKGACCIRAIEEERVKLKQLFTQLDKTERRRQMREGVGSGKGNWIDQLNNVAIPKLGGQNPAISATSRLIFQSYTSRHRNSETIRKLVDEVGKSIMEDGPLSAQGSFSTNRLRKSTTVHRPHEPTEVRPSIRPKSTRNFQMSQAIEYILAQESLNEPEQKTGKRSARRKDTQTLK